MRGNIFGVQSLIFHPEDSGGYLPFHTLSVTKRLLQLPTNAIKQVNHLKKAWVVPGFFVLNPIVITHPDAKTSDDNTGRPESVLILLRSRFHAESHLLHEGAGVR
jgi:hypothetical protein